MKILVAEDSATVRRLVCPRLVADGYDSFRRALYVDSSFGLAAFQLGRAHDALGDSRAGGAPTSRPCGRSTPRTRRVLQQAVAEQGHECVVAHDGVR